MNTAQRARYFSDLWPAACAVKGWKRSDDTQRKAVTLQCMQLVRGPLVSTSDPAFGPDEVTALFCYLEHLGAPDSLDKSARWADCRTDYRAYNRARQADWHEGETYGAKGSKRLRRDRFAGEASAAGEPLDAFDPVAIRKRHLTMATRHQAKQRKARAAAVGHDLPRQAGQDAADEPVAATPAVDDGNPF